MSGRMLDQDVVRRSRFVQIRGAMRLPWAAQRGWGSVLATLLLVTLGIASPSVGAERGLLAALDQAGERTAFYTTTISIPTYPYHEHLTEVYDAGYNMTYPVLDWDAYEASDPRPSPQEYELLVLENRYLTVTLLPELGGRVYQLIDKATMHNHLYQNPVIKPTRWGPPEQGWWLAAGGIEWCLPVDEHGYVSGVPWSWSVITATDGMTVTVYDTQADDRLRAAIDLSLPSDGAYLVVTPRLENPTAVPIEFKFWLNAALAPGAGNRPTEGLEFIFSAPKMAVHSTGDARLPGTHPATPSGPDHRFHWPIHAGIDFSALRNWTQWLGFFEYPQAVRGFAGVYDQDLEEGVVRVFPPEIAKGVKGFAPGWSDPLPWHLWTDEDTGGVELHGGLAPTFWDAVRLDPYDTLSWRELWYPVRDIGTVSVASADASLGLVKDAEGLSVGLHPTRAWASTESELFIWRRATCDTLAHWLLPAIDPKTGYHNHLNLGELTLDEISVAYVDAAGTILAVYGPSGCLDFTMPAPHLGYGVNVRQQDRIPELLPPLGFDWLKLWDEYPGSRLPLKDDVPYRILYNIGCGAYINDLAGWRTYVRSVAQAGLESVDAYEICNEPNVRNANMGGYAPNPERFTELLCIAKEEIGALAPGVPVISGGLAPVGRIRKPWPCGEGNNCEAMDERAFLQVMLDSGAGACMDGFGYHPYGFASPPERDPDLVSNEFAFRGVEKLREMLVDAGLEALPVWATEFNWIRRPSEDGLEMCDGDADYAPYFLWQEVTAQTQADYLVRAFQYADTHWPWMAGMFVWNLDWHDYLPWWPCAHSRYYALRRQDGSDLGAATPGYAALADMPKRPGLLGTPMLAVEPQRRILMSELSASEVLSTSFTILNARSDVLTWTAAISQKMMPVTLSAQQGAQGERLWVTVDTSGLLTGAYTATLTIDALPPETMARPQSVDLVVHLVDALQRVYLPLTLRDRASPSSSSAPLGPSKIGTHAIAEGGTLELVEQVSAAGSHVAVVKAVVDFGYLCDVKEISPETLTIGRWSHWKWESVIAEADPAVQAGEHMMRHMARWAPYRGCVDYWEVLNEVNPPTAEGHAWLGEFFKAAMDIAEANGYRLALFSYSMGVPELYHWEAIAETGVFARAGAGGHILSLHEYGGPLLRDRWGEALPRYPGQDPDDPSLPRYADRGVLAGRYRHLYEEILIPRGEAIPLVITEVNLAIEDPDRRADYFLDEIAWYDDRLREDDYVLGMTIFTLGGHVAQWDHFDYYEFLPDLAARIIALQSE